MSALGDDVGEGCGPGITISQEMHERRMGEENAMKEPAPFVMPEKPDPLCLCGDTVEWSRMHRRWYAFSPGGVFMHVCDYRPWGTEAIPKRRKHPRASRQPVVKPTICLSCNANVRPFFNPTTGAWSFLEMDGETPHKH